MLCVCLGDGVKCVGFVCLLFENYKNVKSLCVKNCPGSVLLSFFNKVAGVRTATLLKKRLWPRCFPVTFPKFLRTSFFIEQPLVADSE